MLNGYVKNSFGVIEQIDKSHKIQYDENYSRNRYDIYGEKTNYISHLRLGYIIGSIGYVPNSIMDVGYGNGSFLKICKSIIPICYGNDISNYPLPKDIKFVQDITSEYVEVICFFDSLEHFENIDFVKNLNCKYVCISVPCCHYYSDEWFDKWKHRRYNEHLFHFNEESLNNFMTYNGYDRLNYTYLEDVVRKSDDRNILTSIFMKGK